MNATDSPVIKITIPESKIERPAAPKPNGKGRWPLHIWLMLIALVFVAHVAAVFIFCEHKFSMPRTVTNVPQLQLANNSSEWLAPDKPALFGFPPPPHFAALGVQKPPLT